MSRLLRVLTALFALVFAVDAFAAGYSCPTYKKYTSCASGYYMTKGGTYNGTPVAGNACTSCPSGYTCAGGTADKKINAVTCSAGQYINGTTCKTCEAGYRCNGQTTYTPNGGIQGRTACSGSTEYQNSTGQTSCKAVSTGYYKSSNTAQTQCPSGYRVGAGAANQNSCVGNFTKTGSQIAPTAVPTNCKAITASGSCTPGTCTYKKNYAGTITSNCTATNCTKPITGVSAKTGYRTNGTSCTACPSGYPNSADGNTGGVTACYSNNKSRPWSGNQTACSKPSNAYSVTCNSCSGSACTYVAYSNSAGNGDGTIKSGCSSNSAACQQTVKSVTCNANYRVNGTSCTACPSGYPNSAANNSGGITACYSNNKSRAWTGGQTACGKPSNCASVTCNSCSGSACTYVAYSNSAGTGDGTIKSGCSSNSAACQQTVKSVTCNANYRVNGTSCTACPSGYPNSAANNSGGITACYSNNKSRAWTGGQTACGKPSNCASVTCNSCSGSACTYVAYSNSAGTGDGTIKSGCSSNSANCQQSVKSVTANAGYYANGTACTICPAGKYCTGGTAAAANCAAGTFRSTTGGTAASSCSACTGATYSGVGATGCTNCPSGYTANTASNKTAASQCQISVAAGKFLSTVNTTTTGTCSAGTYKAAHTVNYGSTSSCAACTTRTKYSGAGAGACSTVSGGYYTTGCNASGNNCTGQSQCTGANYCSGGVSNACPSGYTANTSAGKTAASQCQINVAGGKYIATANTTTQTNCAANTWKSAHTVNYGSTSGCTACPTGYGVGAGAGTAQNTCYISVPAGQYLGTANGTTKSNCVAGTYKAAHNVTYGSTSSCAVCGTNTYSNAQAGSCTACATGNKYYNSGTAAANHAGVGSCVVSCAAGTYVASGGAACTSVGTGYYRAAHTVAQGSTSTRTQCPANYRSGAATGAESGCAASCAAGQYVPTAKAACTTVGTGYYRAAHTVTYGNTSTRTQCPDGYRNGGATGAESSCVMAVAAGKYVATGKSATQTSCAAGTSKAAHNVTYGNTSSCAACTGATYSGAGAGSCTNCPSGYTANTASNKTAASQCQISVAGGKYVATANSATLTTCDAGYACPGGNVNYGSTGARNKCTGVTYSGAGASACTTCPNSATGYYIAGDIHTTINSCYKNVPWTGSHGNGTRNCYYTSGTGTSAVYSSSCDAYKASKCAAAYYYVSGADCTSVGTGYWSAADSITRTQCPTNYQVGAAASAQSGCKTNCAAGTRVATANAACSAITSGNVYMLAHSVNYGATSAAATACPTGYSISGTTAADHDAKNDCKISCGAGTRVASADAVCTTPSGNWYVGAHTVAAGSTSSVNSCLANYTISGTAAADHDAASDCRISCGAGTRIVSANATSCTTPSGNWYVGAHSVPQGSTSSVNSCLANYSISGTAATNHDAASDCRISCSGGTYIAAANNTSCSNVGAGYWAAASTVSQGSAGARNQCASGLTTIGYGAGADEAGDCGRILNVGTDKVYLRSTKKTTPSLNIKIGDQTYYGNMSTATKGKLRVKNGTTTYSVHDDSK